ncbi:MAG TPA: SDR family NAD(P)-dependent oxidoreductase [Caulobacteraceae bacterium]|nr:SDR family NAD(P)-dependent oxidoreductase [Caulobacteraceae bacterium]
MSGMLAGKVALVTGAGHGIGRGHALELAAQGAKVVVNDLGSSVRGEGQGRDAEVVVELIKSRGGEAVADFGNVALEADAEAMVGRGLEVWGRFDILVNNAGIVRDRTIWNMSADDFDAVMAVHVRGPWLTSRAAARYWRAQAKSAGGTYRGRIINTTSGAGLQGNFGQTNYAAAKAAVAGLTLTLALELGGFGVTANVISPGGLTRISSTMGLGEAREPEDFETGDWDRLDPAMSSPVVAWLASEEAQLINGQVLRAVFDRLSWLSGWSEKAFILCEGRRWRTEELGKALAIDVFGTRTPGLRMGS